jgi:hypothetical protein
MRRWASGAARRAGDLALCPAVPEVDVQLQLSVDPPPLTEDQFDVCIRFGEPADTRVIARQLAANRRLLCAVAQGTWRAWRAKDAGRPDAAQLHLHPPG